MYQTLDDIRRAHAGHWFDRGAMEFFGTRFESGVRHGRYFITSEQPPYGPRAFAIRRASDTGDISTVGSLCDYPTLAAAEQALDRIATHQEHQP